MFVLSTVSVLWISSMCQHGNAEMIEQVWPKNKVNLSESYLPAVVQVLTHFVDELEGMEVPDPPEVIHASATSAPTASAAETNVETSQSTEATVITSTESINSTESSETSSASPETPSSTSSRYVLLEEDFDEEGLEDLKMAADADLPVDVFLMVTRLHRVLAKEAKRNGFAKLQEENQTQIPATPYAILERLRDMLAFEARRLLGFNKLQGYSDTVVNELVKSARSTSAEQLRNLLYLMLDNNNVRRKESLAQARIVLNLLNKPCSALLRALEFVPPLPYSLPKTEMCSAKYC